MFLIEIYFSRVYNASLLFHKPRFLYDWATNTVPDFVSLSMFALASIYLHNKNEMNSTTCSEAFNVSSDDWSHYGSNWARLASQKVLAQADTPSMHTAQACQILVLYWFASDQTDRANFHATVAYHTCRLLGYHRNHYPDDIDCISAELRRRCLWSCWMTQCVSQGNAQFSGSSWNEVVGVLLPSDDLAFTDGRPSTAGYLDENGDVQVHGEFTDQSSRASHNAELAKLIGLWYVSNFATGTKCMLS
jgi:Fungal specific transcription factor domain